MIKRNKKGQFAKGTINAWNRGTRRYFKSICKECGIEFKHIPLNRLFCEIACYANYRSKHINEFVDRPMLGRKHSTATKEKLTNLLIGYRKTDKYHKAIKKMLGRRGKTQLETNYENIFKDLGLPYKYVGDGKFSIERKIPDFINTNGKKIAIEVYAKAHKERFRDGLEKWKENRAMIFKKYGWEIIYLDETMMKIEIVKKMLGGGQYNH